MPNHLDSLWRDDAKVAELRIRWNAGESAGRIGKAMGITKNQVIGKAHRLGLEARPSPITRSTETVSYHKSLERVKVQEAPKEALKPVQARFQANLPMDPRRAISESGLLRQALRPRPPVLRRALLASLYPPNA